MLEHTIRNKNGKKEKVLLTPNRAIRYFCLECVGWIPSEVRKCTSPLCALYSYRYGKNPGRDTIGNKSSRKQVAEMGFLALECTQI